MKKPFVPSPRPPSDISAATARPTISIKAACDIPEVTVKNPSSDPTTGRRVARPGFAALLSRYPGVLIDVPARLGRTQCFSLAEFERLPRTKGRGRTDRTNRRPD